MKKTLTIILILASTYCFGQDSTAKKDTVIKTVPVYEKSDTVKVGVLYVENGFVKYVDGYAVRKGFAVQNDKGKWQYTEQPKIVGVLNDKRQEMKQKVIDLL